MALTFQQQQLKQGQYHGQLRSAKTQAEVNSILAAAKREGVALDASVIKSREQAIKSLAEKNTRAKAAQDLVNKQAADKAAADKAAQEAKLKTQQQQQAAAIKATADKLKAQYSTELKTADTAQQINSILDKAKTNGVILDAATVTTATNRAKVADFNQSLRSATTIKQINDLVAKANADKIGYDVQQVASIKEPLIQQAQNKYQQQLAKAASIQDVNAIAKQAQAELGRSLDPASIATQTQNIIQGYTNQIKSAKTQDELAALQKTIQTDGANLDPKLFAGASADIQKQMAAQQAQVRQAEQQAQQQQTQQKIATYREQLQQATTTQQIQDITAQLKKAEIDPDALKYSGLQGIADRQNVILGRQEYEAKAQAERAAQTAQREAEAAKKLQEQQQKLAEGKITMAKAVQDFEKNLPTATSLQDLKPNKRFMFKDSQGMADSIDNPAADKTYYGDINNRVGPDGHLYMQIPANYATGQEGYWVKSLEPETLAKSRHNLLFQPIGTDFQFEKPAAFVNVRNQGKINSQASLT